MHVPALGVLVLPMGFIDCVFRGLICVVIRDYTRDYLTILCNSSNLFLLIFLLRNLCKLLPQLGILSCIMEFGIPKKLARLIKMCLTETYSRAWVGKKLSEVFLLKMV